MKETDIAYIAGLVEVEREAEEGRPRMADEVASAIDANYWKGGRAGRSMIINKGKIPKIRRLTPTECEKLQGFPDGWTAGVSDTQRYKQMGNAVSVPVIKAIGEQMREVF